MKEPNSQQNRLPRPERNPLEWMRWIPLALLVLAFCAAIFIGARIILVPMLCSLALTYLLAPVVAWFEKRGWSRPSSVLLTISSATVTLVLILIFILPGFWGQLTKSYDQARELVGDQSRVEPLLEKVRQLSPPVLRLSGIEDPRGWWFPTCSIAIFSMAGAWLQKGLFRIVDITTSLLDLLLIPFFVYYLLADYRLDA